MARPCKDFDGGRRVGKHFSLSETSITVLDEQAERLTERLGVQVSPSDIITRLGTLKNLPDLCNFLFRREIRANEQELEVVLRKACIEAVNRMNKEKREEEKRNRKRTPLFSRRGVRAE